MPSTTHLSQRRRRWIAVAALSTLAGLVCACLNIGVLWLPGHQKPTLSYSAAVTQVLVDDRAPSVVHRHADSHDINTLVKRTELIGRVIVSAPVLELIARHAGVPAGQVGGIARTTASVPLALIEPADEQRANDILESQLPYRLEVQARPAKPILDIYTQAPTTAQAIALADGAVAGIRIYLSDLARRQGVSGPPMLVVRQLGAARGGPATGGASLIIAALTFFTAFGLVACALLGALHLRTRRPAGRPGAPGPAPVARPAVEAPPASRLRRPSSLPVPDDWPNTNRILPWLFALFLAVLWLVPFNSIQLGVHAPIDLKLDRLVLPLLFGAWVLAAAAGGQQAPRWRLTPIHLAVGAFVACAALSVVLNARYLNEIAELDLAFKKLPLLLSYTALFLIASTAIRATEVRAFMTYTFVMAVIMAVGMIWEYRFKQNLFYQWSDKLLPGAFSVTADSETALDGLGRRMVRGSTGVPLEAVTVLAMALPIGLVRLLQTQATRQRVLYAIGCCALLAAMVATNRKSAMVVPVAVIATMAYFRRRELLRLAPLGLLLVVMVSALSPGALGSTVSQFTRSDRSAVPTTGDRVSDYDAIRPDLWSHFAFGRGWGSYNHESYRILDSEILHRLVEMGVLGLLAFLLVGVAVIACARATIAARDETWAPLALVGAAATAAFFTGSTLFDIMSFPHAPYIFLYMAGLVAVVIRRPLKPVVPVQAPGATGAAVPVPPPSGALPRSAVLTGAGPGPGDRA
jgi:hypothetical protein